MRELGEEERDSYREAEWDRETHRERGDRERDTDSARDKCRPIERLLRSFSYPSTFLRTYHYKLL